MLKPTHTDDENDPRWTGLFLGGHHGLEHPQAVIGLHEARQGSLTELRGWPPLIDS